MTRTRSLVHTGLLVVAIGALLVGCSSGGSLGAKATVETPPQTAPPNRSLTSYGAQFLATCPYSHTLNDDPIVHAGEPGASHEHEFFGSTGTDAHSTFASLVAGSSTCNDHGDRSAYWVPALYLDGERVVPRRVDAYYRVAAGIAYEEVQVMPDGLQAIAGDQHGTTMPDLQVAAWTCGLSPRLASTPPANCTADRPIQLRLTFPSCWDGQNLTSDDHTSHLSYPGERGCDSAHPVVLPQLTLAVHYPYWGPYEQAWLASGGFETTHGDLFEAWEPERMADQVRGCLNRGVTCGIVGGTFHTGQGSGDEDYYNRSEYLAEANADGEVVRD